MAVEKKSVPLFPCRYSSAYESYKKLKSELCNILKNIGTDFFVNFASKKC